MKNQRISLKYLIIFASIIVLIGGCAFQKLTVMPKTPESVVLNVIREDAALSLNHKVVVFLNDIEVTELTSDSHKSLHLMPGVYAIRFEMTDSEKSEVKKITWEGRLEPNDVYMAIVAYNFGWKSWEKFFGGKAGATVAGGQKFSGEIDLRETVKSK